MKNLIMLALILSSISVVSAYTNYDILATSNAYENNVNFVGSGLGSSYGTSSPDMKYFTDITMGTSLEMAETGGSALLNQGYLQSGTDSGSTMIFSSSFTGTNIKNNKINIKMVMDSKDEEASKDESSVDFNGINRALMQSKAADGKSSGYITLNNKFQCTNFIPYSDMTAQAGTGLGLENNINPKADLNSGTGYYGIDTSNIMNMQNSQFSSGLNFVDNINPQADLSPGTEYSNPNEMDSSQITDVQNLQVGPSSGLSPDVHNFPETYMRTEIEFVPFSIENDQSADVVQQSLDAYAEMDGANVDKVGFDFTNNVESNGIEFQSDMTYYGDP